MKDKFTSRFLLSMLAAVVISIAGTSCGPAATNTGGNTTNATSTPTSNTNSTGPLARRCDAATDQKINTDLFEQLVDPVKGDPDLRVRKRQFNFYSENCNVLLYGYVDTIQNFKRLTGIASNHPNVYKIIDTKLFLNRSDYPDLPDSGGGCQGGLIPCGDVCVPPGQCNSNKTGAPAGATPTPTPK